MIVNKRHPGFKFWESLNFGLCMPAPMRTAAQQ